MTDYSQPDFYRFNRDSIELVKWVLSRVKSSDSILDLGAGCGVIGIEVALALRPQRLDLLEVQEDFRTCLQDNLKMIQGPTKCSVYFQGFSDWRPTRTYDLIVGNPPYYLPQRGEASKDVRRGIARGFVRDGWCQLLDCIERSLKAHGHAFLVIKNEKNIRDEVTRALRGSTLKGEFTSFEDLLFLELFRLNVD